MQNLSWSLFVDPPVSGLIAHDQWACERLKVVVMVFQSLAAVKRLRPKRAFFVGMTHDFHHARENAELADWSKRQVSMTNKGRLGPSGEIMPSDLLLQKLVACE